MAPPEGLSRSDVESQRVRSSAASEEAKAVREARAEVDRLIAALAGGQQPGDRSTGEAGWAPGSTQSPGEAGETERSASGSAGPEADERRPAGGDVQDRVDCLNPVHLIISSKRALTKKYGSMGFEQLDRDLQELKQAIETGIGSRRYGSGPHSGADLEAIVVYVDDDESLMRLGLQAADPTNPWQVKMVVDRLDARLREQGQEVRYLLVVGGDDIIPFHRLPNPVDDQDSDVPSDNPYASRDTNYLIPERAIGRIPDEEKGDSPPGIGFLRNLIRISTEAHRRSAVSKGLLSALGAVLERIPGVETIPRPGANGRGLGYSASIWRKASRAVFRVIGDDSHLRTCPPLTYEGFRVVEPPRLSYFNLHGIEDGPNWYGQRDALFPADYPLFPLALRPQDPSIDEHVNAVVFTEACYGANVLGKSEGDSIALRFLAAGALAVIGSTKVSYGSIAPPLLGADLIGKYFWEGLRVHLTVGEALRHAKVTLASEMQKREGYLDDEDQKALISFVLYGDPALPVTGIRSPAGWLAPRLSSASSASQSHHTLCPSLICSERAGANGQSAGPVPSQKGVKPVSDEMVARVKARIEASLPHMSHAKVRARPLTVCKGTAEGDCDLLDEDALCALRHSLDQKGLKPSGLIYEPRGWAVMLQKDIPVRGEGDVRRGRLVTPVDTATYTHHQVVKVVVDENGHILRVAVSK